VEENFHGIVAMLTIYCVARTDGRTVERLLNEWNKISHHH
jgi:hypothetical protein